ncbi:MAG: hypothetical protein IJV07_02495 [Alphaproteobacteria bacterium]|nr:hypothetical protein [Alphaproteobacteria bacterium]
MYQRTAPFTPDEMTFQTVEQPLLGKGLIFRNPNFPVLPIRMNADRMALQVDPLNTKVHLSGVIIDFAGTLLDLDHHQLLNIFSEFKVPDGFIRQPIEAFVLFNRDLFQGSVILEITPSGTMSQMVFLLEQGNKEILQVRTTVKDIRPGLWGWTAGHIQTVNLTISDRDLMTAMAGYYRAVRQPVPDSLKQALNMNIPYHTVIRLTEPVQLSKLFKRD